MMGADSERPRVGGVSLSVEGRVAVVTGAGQGIGRAIAVDLARAGAKVVIADSNAETAAQAAAEIAAEGGTALAIASDVTDPASLAAMVAATAARFGRLDILVNNAGLYTMLARRPFDEIPLEEWDRVLRVNTTGAFLAARAAVGLMRAAGWGRIVNIASGSVAIGAGNMTHYVTSKAALIGMTRAMARELGAHGITVNAVLPGMTETGIAVVGRRPEHNVRINAGRAIQRDEVPEDIVGAVRFLASPAAGYITGQSLLVDGGSAFL
ncbi:MAG: glucose 1-dehydrogenase [Variibacter sp.]|nr:glucose 1-dehydrogenase [Variibacter sp.]